MEGGNIRLKRYLLGILPEKENEEIDLRIISDESFEEDLRQAEHDLIEDYLENALSADETRLFRANFLTPPKRYEKLREISALKEFAKKEYRHNEQGKFAEGGPERSHGFYGLAFRPLLAFGGIAVLLISLVLIWNNFSRRSRSPLETESAELNRRDLSDLGQTKDYYAINLRSETFRSSGEVPNQGADRFTDPVLLRLALPANVSDNTVFRTEIRRDGAVVLVLESVRSYRNPAGAEIRVLLPKQVLPKGRYQISVQSGTDGSVIGSYFFIVE